MSHTTSTTTSTNHGMILRYPATRWQDALPTGSGVVGAMMYGKICDETIVLNHDRLYYPKPRTPLVDVSDALPELRSLIAGGEYRKAAQLMPELHARRSGVEEGSTSTLRDPYQPHSSLTVNTGTDGPFRQYRRGIDFSTGVVWTRWTDNTATFERELFVSRASDTVDLRIRGNNPGVVRCAVSLHKAIDEQVDASGWAGSGDVDMEVIDSGAPSGNTLRFSAVYAGELTYGAVARADVKGGKLQATPDGLAIEGADELILRARLFVGEDPEPAIEGLAAELENEDHDFDAALSEHVRLHKPLFSAVNLDLHGSGERTNEELMMDAYDGAAPAELIKKMFDYGRYLLICSSRPGSWPANLQGVWNGDYSPAWNSDYHTDENIQMNYWAALSSGLQDAALPFFDYFESFLDDYRENARKIYGCRGILMPIAQTTHGGEVPCIWSNWISAAGWIGQHFYDYYLFTGDEDFLRDRAVPWLEEVALFYEDFLVEENGALLFSPSLSPENVPSGENKGLVTIDATMDVAVCREVLGNLCTACTLLEIDSDGVDRWQAMLSRLPEYEINHDGALKEWLHPAFPDNYHHRHQSHIYPLFPGLEVTEESSKELFDASRVAVEKRLVIGLTSQTGWSMAHMANIYARLGDGDRALECLELLARGSTGPNLLTYHNDWRDMGLTLTWGRKDPPFQIDANFGIAAAVLEMLTFSNQETIKLLPALPAKWRRGSVAGVRCRGGVSVDIKWDLDTRAFSAKLTPGRKADLLLKLPDFAEGAEIGPARFISSSDHGPLYRSVSFEEGVTIEISGGS